ncbi:MAG: phage minor head protein [Bacillota bacterium]
MKSQTRQFEAKYIRARNQIERKGLRLITQALRVQYKQFLDAAMQSSPSFWKDLADRINKQPIQQFFEQFYPMSAQLGVMTYQNMMNQTKSIESEVLMSTYQLRMRKLLEQSEYAERIVTITNTTSERINAVLSEVLSEAELNGYGIEKIKTTLKDAIGANFRGNAMARAKAIAQTEMISASNQASTYAADSTGMEYRKYWSTSHLQGIRPSHIQAEQDSIARGGLRKDELFSNGLRFPGDPSAPADEVVNCRCSVLHEIV